MLRTSETAKFEEYAKALRQVFLAGVYLLVLLNLLALLAKAVRFAFRLAAIVAWPIRALWLIFNWTLKA